MTTTKYEIGGFLVDAHGVRHEIKYVGDCEIDFDGYSINITRASHYVYEPPPRILSLQEAIEAAKAGETLQHKNQGSARFVYAKERGWLQETDGTVLLVDAEDDLTGWRIVPQAKPLPAMTERLAKALELFEERFEASEYHGVSFLVAAYREAKESK